MQQDNAVQFGLIIWDLLYPTGFPFTLITLWINKYHLLINHTFGSGSTVVNIYDPDF